MSSRITRWALARLWPFAGPAVLHRAALAAAAAGEPGTAALLFARAVRGYRREIRVAALARLRVHEQMARWRESGDETLAVEIERRLARLDEIESPAPPFERIPAHDAMGTWRETPIAHAGSRHAA